MIMLVMEVLPVSILPSAHATPQAHAHPVACPLPMLPSVQATAVAAAQYYANAANAAMSAAHGSNGGQRMVLAPGQIN